MNQRNVGNKCESGFREGRWTSETHGVTEGKGRQSFSYEGHMLVSKAGGY